jgi:hypothetical protein
LVNWRPAIVTDGAMMFEDSPITVTRHASYDDVLADDSAGLSEALRVALVGVSGQSCAQLGAVLPFAEFHGPARVHRVPPVIGDRLLAVLPPAFVRVEDHRGPLAVAIDPARVANHARNFQAAAKAIVSIPRGILTTSRADERPPLAALIAKACGPLGGVVLTRDRRQAAEVAFFFRAYQFPAEVIGALPAQTDSKYPRTSDDVDQPESAWVVVPVGHPAWVRNQIPDPPVIVAADPLAACRAKILHRLFGGLSQCVYGLMRTDLAHAVEDPCRLTAAFGDRVHDLQPG